MYVMKIVYATPAYMLGSVMNILRILQISSVFTCKYWTLNDITKSIN